MTITNRFVHTGGLAAIVFGIASALTGCIASSGESVQAEPAIAAQLPTAPGAPIESGQASDGFAPRRLEGLPGSDAVIARGSAAATQNAPAGGRPPSGASAPSASSGGSTTAPGGGSGGTSAPGGSTTAPGGGSGGASAPAGGTTTPASGGAAPAAPKAAAELLADEAIRELRAMKSSEYDHTTYVDESRGTFNYDCSGFLRYALEKAAPDALSTLKAGTVSRPLAKHFEAFLEAIPVGGHSGRWQRVERAANLVAGDVVAWLRPASVESSNTGHVLMVRANATVNPDRVDEVLVPITDSTSSPHGSADSRMASGATGLGTGTIGLLVDMRGAPYAYRWTGGKYSVLETAIALGHLE